MTIMGVKKPLKPNRRVWVTIFMGVTYAIVIKILKCGLVISVNLFQKLRHSLLGLLFRG